MTSSDGRGMLQYSKGATGERVYSAPDIASALEFATRSLQQGDYQFFRGQENASWLPYPSLARVPENLRDKVIAQVATQTRFAISRSQRQTQQKV